MDDFKAKRGEKCANPGQGESMRMALVDFEHRYHSMQHPTPGRVQVDRQKQDAVRLQHPVNLAHHLCGILDVVDYILRPLAETISLK